MISKRLFMFHNDRIITANDRFIPGRIRCPGVFETMLYDRGVIYFWERHLRRLRAGLSLLWFPKLKIRFRPIVRELIRLNGPGKARVRLMIWREGKTFHSAATVTPHRAYPSARIHKGFNIYIPRIRLKPFEHPADLKAVSYQPYAQVYQRARVAGYDDALLLNRQTYIAETSRANIFFVKGKDLLTPACSCGCLKGITRQIILDLARAQGYRCRPVRLNPREISAMDEVFLTNSLIGIMPVVAIKGFWNGQHNRRPVTNALADAYRGFCQAYRRTPAKKL